MQLIKPSPLEIFLISFFSLVMIGVAAYDQLANQIFLIPDVRSDFETTVSSRFDVFLNLVDQFSFSADIITVLLWNVIGAIVFIFVWLIINMIVDFRNNVAVSATFVHGRSFHQSDFWAAYILRLFFRVAVLITVVAGTALWITIFLPTAFTAVEVTLTDSSALTKLTGLLGVFTAMVLTLHFLFIFVRLLFWKGDPGIE